MNIIFFYLTDIHTSYEFKNIFTLMIIIIFTSRQIMTTGTVMMQDNHDIKISKNIEDKKIKNI